MKVTIVPKDTKQPVIQDDIDAVHGVELDWLRPGTRPIRRWLYIGPDPLYVVVEHSEEELAALQAATAEKQPIANATPVVEPSANGTTTPESVQVSATDAAGSVERT